MQQRVLNIVQSAPDNRDFVFRLNKPVVTPDTHSLESFLPGKVRDQGNEGSCGGHMACEFFETIRHLQWHILKNPTFDINTYFSVANTYWNIRKRMGDTKDDTGIDIRTGFESLVLDGICRESLEEYVDGRFAVAPSAAASAEAAKHRLTAYHRVMNSRDVVECLFSNYPVGAGLKLYSEFMSDEVANTGIVPLPAKGSQLQGGHAVLIHSYDKKKKIGNSAGAVKILNSWGPDWGEKGHFWISFDYIDQYAMDLFTAHLGHWGPISHT